MCLCAVQEVANKQQKHLLGPMTTPRLNFRLTRKFRKARDVLSGPLKYRMEVHRIALVERGVTLELAQRVRPVLVGA